MTDKDCARRQAELPHLLLFLALGSIPFALFIPMA